MLSLVKIRAQYLKRHMCGVYCSYLFIPSIIIILLLIAIANRFYSQNKYKDEHQNKGSELESNLNLFQLNEESKNDIYLSDFTFLVEDNKDCDILKGLISNYNPFDCTDNEADDTNKNLIKIINKNGKYDIQFFQDEDSYFFDRDVFDSERMIDPFYCTYHGDHSLYQRKQFLYLQSILAQFLIKKRGKVPNKSIVYNTGINTYPPNNGIYTDIMGIVTGLGIVICLQFSMTTYFFNMRMVDEKEKKLTILLERQGVSKTKYFLSWMLTYLFLAIIPFFSFLFFYLLYIPVHVSLFIINMIFFICNLFSYAYFLYVCISTTKTASILIKFLNFTTSILGWPITFPQTSKLAKILLGFFPQINFYLCCTSIDKLKTFYTLSWEKIWLRGNKMSYMETIIIYISSIIFYSLLSIFIESYKNSGLGFFLYIRSFFTKVSRNIVNNQIINNDNVDNQNISDFERHFQELSPFNKQRKEQNDCLKIVNISKEFGLVKAVDNFNADLFGNEIFCLLGHNGAGKTTLVNMISGIFDPTNGDIFYKGRSIITDKNYLFENIGVCQQEDIFFDYLTVSEHLKYMCEIKGGNANANEVTDLILRIGLAEKASATCSSLSGGQKRKLCTALALIGNSKIILLDEPTSGMDPIAKKSLWDFLKGYQHDKIILLTTHSLDEAEYLGDRIGIMSDGHFICCGTSTFLKSKYPCGFNINLLINPNKFNENKKREIYEKIKSIEPQVTIRVASKSVFSINIQSNTTNADKIFNIIEQSKADFGIEDYTVASTSLEDVFLKINNKADINDMEYINREQNNQIDNIPNLVEITDFCSQLVSQLHRNWLPIKRNVTVLILEFLSGLGIIYIFVFLLNGLTSLASSKLDLKYLLESHDIIIYEPNSLKNYLSKSYAYKTTDITMKRLSSQPKDITDLIDMSYKKAYANIAESSIAIMGNDNNYLYVDISQYNIGYYCANVMFTVSAFLKNEYDIDATILSKMELKQEMNIGNKEKMNEDTIGVLIIVCFGSVFGFVIYLGGLINEKIKERKTNIKHLLYLSGSNSWSYWLAFFIIDFLKLLVFTILLIIPIYYVNSRGGYYFLLNMLAIDVSSLVFIYFVSFFGGNADSGVKFLFVLLLAFVIFLIFFFIFAAFLSLISPKLILAFYESFSNSYNFTIFDISPITSMLLSFGRILYGVATYDGHSLSKYGAGTYLLTSYMVQAINIVFYGILLILMEIGLLREFLNFLKLKFCVSENNFVFSEEQVSNEFMIYNDVTNPLVLNQMDNNNANQPVMYGNNNNQYNANQPIYGNNMNQNNTNIAIYGNNNMNQNNTNISIYGSNNMNQNNTNISIYGRNNMNQNIINMNQNNINIPNYGNNNINQNIQNNQNNLNTPIYGNNADLMNVPIYGNNIDNLNIPVYDNDNEPNALVINNSINNNMSQPLLDTINTSSNININTNTSNNINNNINYSNNNNNLNNNNIRVDNIDTAMNDLVLPETNRTYGIRKGNPYVNNEKDNLSTRNDFTTRIEGLRKTFWFCCKKSVRAVDNLYLGLEANEKFGLLGFNGSGKTTTFKSITNEILYDYGKITLFGHDNRKEFEKIRRRIGYCPQENPLFEFMNVREILEFYSDLKTCNIPYQTICEKFGLTKYLDTYCINLSGGNKRKLTFAIAIMNKPTLLLLDEPSTGVDPDSRRLMWKNINELSNTGHKYNMILTTHSMEEAEILCDRVSWLKKGNFVCIGNPEKLKIKYSLGYKLHVKFNDEIISRNYNNNQPNNIAEKYRIISGLVTGFTNYSNYIMNNPPLEPYLQALIDVINRIKDYNRKITLVEIGKDLSFKLVLNNIPDKKQLLFSEILGMKNKNNLISEMIISMESLENILTSFR